MSKIKDPSLAEEGRKKIRWVSERMKVLNYLARELEPQKPFDGIRIGMSIHLEAKTAWLALTFKRLGAEVYITSSNPLSTQDDVAAALAAEGVNVFAWRGETDEEYMENQREVLRGKPNLILDDGLDLTATIVREMPEVAKHVIGASEETTTGVKRARALAKQGLLPFPLIALNDASIKHMFDNRYGTGESAIVAISRATNLLIRGKTVVVAGYGWCGKGISTVARGLGAHTVVTEVDPVRALEAFHDGHMVMPMDKAAEIGDIFITATGMKDVIRREHLLKMKDGALLANAGHFNVEIDIKALNDLAEEVFEARPNVKGYRLKNGKTLYLLGEGRLVNLVVGDGHPAEIMDLSFSAQLMAMLYLKDNAGRLPKDVVEFPEELSRLIAKTKLNVLGIEIDSLTREQKAYLERW